MPPQISVETKYSQPEVVSFWQSLSRQGLQKCEQEMVRRYLPEAGCLLDIGCGAGRAGLALSQTGYTVTGLDLSLPMLQAGRNLSSEARLNAANLLDLPFAAGVFDGVLMFFGALQHVSGRARRRQALAGIARVSRSSGRLVLGLDNLAPALICYLYWLKEKLSPAPPILRTQLAAADATLWSRESRRVHPFIWHARGLARTLRWRTWPNLVDHSRRYLPGVGDVEPGDTYVAQFSLQSTPGLVYYHLYQADELVSDAASAGWRLLAHYSGTELNEARRYPPAIRRADKQQLFAFEKSA